MQMCARAVRGVPTDVEAAELAALDVRAAFS